MLHARIVDEDVDFARRIHHRGNLRGIGQVGARMRRAELFAQLRDHGRIAETIEDQRRPLGSQRPRNRESDTAGRSGDERALAGKKHLGLRAL